MWWSNKHSVFIICDYGFYTELLSIETIDHQLLIATQSNWVNFEVQKKNESLHGT